VRVFWVVSVVGVAVLATPSVAQAHLRSGTVAVDYGARVVRPRPSPTAPFAVIVYQSDRALRLSVRDGHTVVVIGYLGERFLRVDRARVAVNRASPTAAGSGLLAKGERSEGPAGWTPVRGHSSVVWHDPRLQGLPPGAIRASWSIPVLVDGRRERITGEIWRLAAPALWPWLLVLGFFAALTALLGVAKDRRRLRTGCILAGAVAAVAGIVAAGGFALGAYASPGTWIAGADEFVFAAAGFGVLVWGPRNADVPAGIGLGLLGLATGLSEGGVFLHGGVLSALPALPTRAAAALAIGAGVAGLVTGGLFYLQHPPEPAAEGAGLFAD
jgi:hypothetical protein